MSATGILELSDTLKLLAMPVLQLGCDVDYLVKQIFRPSFLQLIHWSTSPTQLRSPHTAIIIDTLMVRELENITVFLLFKFTPIC